MMMRLPYQSTSWQRARRTGQAKDAHLHPSFSQDLPNTSCTSDCVGRVHWHPWRPARHLQTIRRFLYPHHSATIATPSCCGSSTRWGKRQPLTSNSGNGQRDSNMTAMAMDSTRATQWQYNGRRSGAATAGSAAAASAASAASAAQGWRRQRGGS